MSETNKQISAKDLTKILKDIVTLIKEKNPNYKIIKERFTPNKFWLKDRNETIGYITILHDDDDVIDGVCHIPSLSIDPEYQQKGLGKLLLIYGMIRAKIQYSTINEYRLDDVSDNNNYMGKNIYNQLGFLGDVRRVETNKKSSSYAPDKIAYFPNFLLRALRQTKLAKKYEDLYDKVAKIQVISRTLRARPPRESGGKTRRNRP